MFRPPPINWVTGTLSPWVKRTVREADDSCIVPRLKASGAITLPFRVFLIKTTVLYRIHLRDLGAFVHWKPPFHNVDYTFFFKLSWRT
jgi:hypothetical protein